MALTTVDQGLLSTNAQYTGFKNRLINSAMVIDQRNAGASVTLPDGAGNYSFVTDRFACARASGATATGIQSSTAPTGFNNSLLITNGTGITVSSSGQGYITHFIEGYNVADLGFGTANAKTVTLSFWVQSSITGTHSGALNNSAFNRSYPFTFTISSANTWTQVSVTIAGDTSGTWLTTNGRGICVTFNNGSGSTYLGTASAWAGATYFGATGSVALNSVTSSTFYITGVQLEKGSTATSFDYRPYGTELQLCQRYYWRQGGSNAYQYFGLGFAYNTTNATFTINNPVPMRATPSSLDYSTIGVNDGATLTAVTSVSADLLSPIINQINATVASGLTQFRPMRILANNSTSAYLGFNAEL
jgi:hypothetical protein